VADFGHGLFEGKVLDSINNSNNFISLNVQTNSENYGFNCYHKHKNFDYLSIDERECRIGMHDRFSPIDKLSRKLYDKLKIPMSITLGAKGSMFFDKDGRQNICPSLFNYVVDTTGAGDAYFLLTSLLQKQNIKDPLVIPFLGNVYAGIKTGIIGNSSSVSKIDFIRTLKSILS
jgi:sugar/nucleoside kinase (ribokinase family)